MKKRFLVLGGRSVVGRGIIAAIRHFWGAGAEIVATTTQPVQSVLSDPAAIQWLSVDIKRSIDLKSHSENFEWLEVLKAAAGARGFDATFFCLAGSRAIGIAAAEVTSAQAKEAYDNSVWPLVQMFKPSANLAKLWGTGVVISSFYQLPLCQWCYGAMIGAKIKLEEVASDWGLQIFRFGALAESKSLRAIAIMTERQYGRRYWFYPHLFPLVPVEYWTGDHLFIENLRYELAAEERLMLGSQRLTTSEDVRLSFLRWFEDGLPVGVVNTVGSRRWEGEVGYRNLKYFNHLTTIRLLGWGGSHWSYLPVEKSLRHK